MQNRTYGAKPCYLGACIRWLRQCAGREEWSTIDVVDALNRAEGKDPTQRIVPLEVRLHIVYNPELKLQYRVIRTPFQGIPTPAFTPHTSHLTPHTLSWPSHRSWREWETTGAST